MHNHGVCDYVEFSGAGGVGQPLVAMLSRLGVGTAVVPDPERIEPTNLPRLDARRLDAMMPLRRVLRLSGLADRLSTKKVTLARRIAKRANPKIDFIGIPKNVIEPQAAMSLIDCDFIFLAADSHQARMVFNAITHQFLIPGSRSERGSTLRRERRRDAQLVHP